ncbi:SDR family oxidoreductase [Methylobacterium mesophilicum]
MKMTGNTMLVTGGTSGIGRRLAEAFHDLGNTVIVAGRRREMLDEVAMTRPAIMGLHLDLDDQVSVQHAEEKLRRHFPALNVLVANAGISSMEDVTAEGWDSSAAEAMVQTNITGVLRQLAAFMPLLAGKDGATIMTTTSNLAFVPRATLPTYCATKAFLHSYLQSLRWQLRGKNIEVLELAPPYVATELSGRHQATDPRAMPLDAFVAEVMTLLERSDHSGGEVLVERARDTRSAEREGRYEALFATMNPAC